MVKVILHPHPDYLPKVPFSAVHPVILEAFCPPPFTTPEQEKSHRLCPVRALQAYIHRTSQWRKSEQLFVCYGGSNKGAAATKQTMSHWVRDAIALAYEARGQASPTGLRAHSTRGVASSSALARGAPLQQSSCNLATARVTTSCCRALLAGLPACATKPLQMIQNAAARLVFNEPKRAHVTPLFISLHWLPLAARIKFKALTLAYRTITGSAPSYFHSLLRVYIPTRHLRSVNERRLVVPSQKATKSLSRTFSFTVPCWWNALPTLIRNAESLTTFKKQLKTNLFREHLTL
ncbi:hypothetical protein PO909_032409 [Leuciscus waleckii]